METVLALSYKCRECPQVFGDPESERDFLVWAQRVSEHIYTAHKIARVHYLNDMLKAQWSRESNPR